MMRRAFTLTELLISIVISLIILAAIGVFFSYGYKITNKIIDKTQGESAVFNVAEIISSDLRKAGYGNPPNPVSYTGGVLQIEYVDYEKSGCDGLTWGTNPACDFTISYKFEDNNIKRDVNGSGFFPMLDENKVDITNFVVNIDNTTKTVYFKISGIAKTGNFTVENSVICRNWQF